MAHFDQNDHEEVGRSAFCCWSANIASPLSCKNGFLYRRRCRRVENSSNQWIWHYLLRKPDQTDRSGSSSQLKTPHCCSKLVTVNTDIMLLIFMMHWWHLNHHWQVQEDHHLSHHPADLTHQGALIVAAVETETALLRQLVDLLVLPPHEGGHPLLSVLALMGHQVAVPLLPLSGVRSFFLEFHEEGAHTRWEEWRSMF